VGGGYGIRYAFGICVVGCGISIILKMIASAYKLMFFDVTSTVVILGLTGSVAFYIFINMIRGAKNELAMKKAAAKGGVSMAGS
jgi:hypothetical protein